MFPQPQATSTDHGGPRTSDLSIESRRRNNFTTAPDQSHFAIGKRCWYKMRSTCFIHISPKYSFNVKKKPVARISAIKKFVDFQNRSSFCSID